MCFEGYWASCQGSFLHETVPIIINEAVNCEKVLDIMYDKSYILFNVQVKYLPVLYFKLFPNSSVDILVLITLI